MASTFNDNIAVNSPKALENRSGRFVSGTWRPYLSVAEANQYIPTAYRHKTLSVWIQPDAGTPPVEYIYLNGVTDADLVARVAAGGMAANDVYNILEPSLHTAFPMVFTKEKLSRHYGTEVAPMSGTITLDDTNSVRERSCVLHYQDTVARNLLNISGYPVSVFGATETTANMYNYILFQRGTLPGRYVARIANAPAVSNEPGTGPVLLSATIKGDELNALYLAYNMDIAASSAVGFSLSNANGITITGKSADITESTVLKLTLSGNMDLLATPTLLYDNTNQTVKSSPGGLAAAAITSPFGITVSDTVGPGYVNGLIGDVNATTLRLLYNEALKTNSIPLASNFVVKINGAVVAVTNVAISGVYVVLTLANGIVSSADVVTIEYTGTLIQDASGNPAANIPANTPVINALDFGAASFKAIQSDVVLKTGTSTNEITRWNDTSGSRDASNNLEDNHINFVEAQTLPALTSNVTPNGKPTIRTAATTVGLITRNNLFDNLQGGFIIWAMRHNTALAPDGNPVSAPDANGPVAGDTNETYIQGHVKGFESFLVSFGVANGMQLRAENRAELPISEFPNGTFKIGYDNWVPGVETRKGVNVVSAVAPKPSFGFVPKARVEGGTVINTVRGSGGVYLTTSGKDIAKARFYRGAKSVGEIKDLMISFASDNGITFTASEQTALNAMEDVHSAPVAGKNAVVGRQANNIIRVYVTGVLAVARYEDSSTSFFTIGGLEFGNSVVAVDIKTYCIDIELDLQAPHNAAYTVDYNGDFIRTPKGKVLAPFSGLAVSNFVINDAGMFLVIDPANAAITTAANANAAPEDLLPVANISTRGTSGRQLLRWDPNTYGVIAPVRDGVKCLVSKYRQGSDGSWGKFLDNTSYATMNTHTVAGAMTLYFAITTEATDSADANEAAPVRYILGRINEYSNARTGTGTAGDPYVTTNESQFGLRTDSMEIWDATAHALKTAPFVPALKNNRTYIGAVVCAPGLPFKVYLSNDGDGTILKEHVSATALGSMSNPAHTVPLSINSLGQGGTQPNYGLGWWYSFNPATHALNEIKTTLDKMAGRLNLPVDTSILGGGA